MQAKQNIGNRGLINSNGLTRVEAGQELLNTGTGRIYGNHVALAADKLNNREENAKAAVVAARERLDIGAAQITNQEEATLFSGGDLHIGRSLKQDNQATGVADGIRNLSATIEALGNGVLSSKQILNRNEHFSIQPEVEVGQAQDFHEISPRGQDGRRISWDLLKWTHFSRAKKVVFKDNKELAQDGKTVLGVTPIPNIFELDENQQIRQDARYLPDDAAWAYFGITPLKTNPPEINIPSGVVEPPLPEGKSENNRDACAQYWKDCEAYDLAIKPYTDWYAENAEAYEKLDEAITQYNRNKT